MYQLKVPTSRERILAAARRELMESGILGLRMEVVAELADVSVPLIYKYYRNRDGLLTEILSELYDGDSYDNLGIFSAHIEQMEAPTVEEVAIVFATVQQSFNSLGRWTKLQIMTASIEIPELRTRLEMVHRRQQQQVIEFLEVVIRALASKNPGATQESIAAAVSLAPPLASLIMTQSFGAVLDDFIDYEEREAASEDMKVLLRLIIASVLTADQ